VLREHGGEVPVMGNRPAQRNSFCLGVPGGLQGFNKGDDIFDGSCLAEEEINFRIDYQLAGVFVVIPRHEDKRDIIVVREVPHITVEPDAVERWHKNITDDQVYLFAFKNFPALLPVLSEEHLMAILPEYVPHNVEEALLVVYQKNSHGTVDSSATCFAADQYTVTQSIKVCARGNERSL